MYLRNNYNKTSVPDKKLVSGQKPDRGSYLTRQMKCKNYLDIATITDKKGRLKLKDIGNKSNSGQKRNHQYL